MSEPVVRQEVAGGVARVTINQPAKGNTLTPDVQDLLEQALGTVERDESVVVLVITGAGERHFCGGLHSDLVTRGRPRCSNGPGAWPSAWPIYDRS